MVRMGAADWDSDFWLVGFLLLNVHMVEIIGRAVAAILLKSG
jgi:hypothetical protein